MSLIYIYVYTGILQRFLYLYIKYYKSPVSRSTLQYNVYIFLFTLIIYMLCRSARHLPCRHHLGRGEPVFGPAVGRKVLDSGEAE